MRAASLLFLLLLAGAGCQAGNDDDSATDDDTGDDDTTFGDDDDSAAACTFPDVPAAHIEIVESWKTWSEEKGSEERSSIRGWLLSAPEPHYHSVLLEQGQCRYLEYLPGLCNPPCETGHYCSGDGICEPMPDAIDGGLLTITGLGNPLEITPTSGTYWGPYPIDEDLFDALDPITATVAGDVFPATTWSTLGVESMDRALADDGLDLQDGQDTLLTWTPGPDPHACVELRLNGTTWQSGTHGMPLDDIIWCVGPDDGSMTIPAALIDPFPPWDTPESSCFGIDCPPSVFSRFTRDVVTTPQGPTELFVASTVFFGFRHPE